MEIKPIRSVLVYACFLLIFGIAIYFVLNYGKNMEPSTGSSSASVVNGENSTFLAEIGKNVKQPIALLLLQLLVILGTARALGSLLAFFGQPSVIGEIIAGILLGPSFLGTLWPETAGFLFPKESLKIIQSLSNVGLLLFLFLIGMELNLGILGKKAHDAVVVSHASILFPFFLGTAYSLTLYESLAPKGISFIVFGLFMGIAMSITAFPVLARIVQERGLTKTPLGTLVITCAAADDITAWCILAGVVAIAQAGSLSGGFITVGLSIVYVILMLFAIRPLLRKIASVYPSKEALRRPITAFVFMIWIASAYLTELIGIHALFGAFFAGVIMPPQIEFRRMLSEKIEDISLLLLLPLFFVSTGLKTQIGLLSDGNLWMTCASVIGIAILGKFLGSTLAARLVGQNWKDSLSIGALMNTRGLMELVVLNIGYDLGILSKEIFAMMVLMALFTTFMTGPVLDLLETGFFSQDLPVIRSGRKILLSFASPASGVRLLELAAKFFPENRKKIPALAITVLHVTSSGDLTPVEAESLEKEIFLPLEEKGEELGRSFDRVYKNTPQVAREILNQARKIRPDLLLMGRSHSLFSAKEIAGRVRFIMENSPSPVGILVDKGWVDLRKIAFLVFGKDDIFLRRYFEFFSNLPEMESTILELEDTIPGKDGYLRGKGVKKRRKVVMKSELKDEDWAKYDLVFLGWKFYREIESTDLAARLPSILILTR
ncbi:cation/H(+) antiporter [Leptospira fluminis]|uniref:Cation/H(+) antiporter n=1 Tax=Leptospira fluminis TaxID=2484979 RepID=A0A4R9GNI7_9LEPT|nr:cation:proton antiporter [Leptospira fluminis]TGK17986.1 cation/H(+) antiporter [Leptospira fluminis]